MKKLRFESLELLSLKERKALTVRFHPLLTVIQGENDVGKSSVIKSLYWAFGATPPKIHPTWAKANVKALVTFTVNGIRYRILRNLDNFGVFNASGKMLLSTSQVTKELAPFIAELVDFKLIFTNREQTSETPPPAYAFLPFYVDQDAGWRKPLESFAHLTQYADFRKDLLEYHTGILPNEYYELSAERRRLEFEQKTLDADRSVVRKAIARFNLQAVFDGLELSTDGHEQAIEQLLQRLQQVKQVRQERAGKLADILDQRMILDQQAMVVRSAIGELEKDAKFAGELDEVEVFCPTCGTVHRNDFANRYSIVQDREACIDFLADAQQKIRALTLRARVAEADVRGADQTLEEIQSTLDTKRGEVSLLEVIESRGRRIAANMFDSQLEELDGQIAGLLTEIAKIEERLKEIKDKKRREEIVSFYAKHIIQYLNRLAVTNYTADEYTRIPARVAETGSDLPRAILAYFLAILATIHQHSTALFAPIVIDSPNQQDQDPKNVAAMIDLIIASRPDDAQTILGTVSLHGRQIEEGLVIEFTKKLSVLRENEYEGVLTAMQPLMDQMTI